MDKEEALQALEEVIPLHLRASRHGENYLGKRFDVLKKFIEDSAVEITFLRSEYRTVVNMLSPPKEIV